MNGSVRVAVVGGGPAGLAVSAQLARARCPHVVLERGRIGWSWRTQRWDSFRLNTPGWMNRVPGKFLESGEDAFATAGELVAGLERLARRLPVVENIEVYSARRSGAAWRVDTSRGSLSAEAIVVASGFQNVPRKPAYAHALPQKIRQLHAADYRRPSDVDGSVLVVGGAQSGLQIAEDLLRAGKRVYLSTSRVARLPRRFLGRDAFAWLREMGQLDVAREDADAATIAATPPQVGGGYTISYQQLAARGVTLLGHAIGLEGHALALAPDLGDNVRFADEAAMRFRAAWSKRARLIARTDTYADSADDPAPHLYETTGPATLDFAAAGISTVIWATGLGPSTQWLPSDALDERHHPQMPGLHVTGAPWVTHRSSANLYGMAADAERIASALARVPLSAAA
ncbi:MAG: flavin-containing monooxygenase [Gaiellaceae bacterium]